MQLNHKRDMVCFYLCVCVHAHDCVLFVSENAFTLRCGNMNEVILE